MKFLCDFTEFEGPKVQKVGHKLSLLRSESEAMLRVRPDEPHVLG